VRFIVAATFLPILAASCLRAQAPPVTSSLPNAGAAIGVLLNGPYGPINFTPLAAGKFSSASQSNGDDIITITFGTASAGQISCLQNLGSGTFSQPINSQTILWPVAAVQLLNFGTSAAPQTDSIAIANSNGVAIYSFTNCVATLTSQVAISNVSSISGLIAGTEQFLISCSNGLAIEDVTLSSSTCLPFPANSIVVTGALPAPYQFLAVAIVPTATQPSNNPEIVFGYVGTGGTLVSTNLALLEGEAFLGCVFSPAVVCFSADENIVSVQPLLTADLNNNPPNLDFSASQNLTLAEIPVAFVSGNLFGTNDNGSDIEFAGYDSIYQYIETVGAATWTLQNTLVAPPDSAITRFTAGSVIPGETDAIAESAIVTPNETYAENEYAVVWASTALSEQETSPPTFTSASSVSFTEMQAGFFQVTASGPPAPLIWESGFLPQGVTFNAGVLSGTPAQGTAGTYNEIVFTAANGVGTPATQSFTLSIISDAPPLVGFNVTNENPSGGSFTQLPAEGPQQGCPNRLGGCYPEGTVVTLTATPNAGFVFGTWTGFPGCGTSSVCVVTMGTQAVVLTLSFAQAPPAVTTPTPSQTGAAGSSFTFPLSATGFSTTPTYTASCSIPAGACTINGKMLVVTTTARTSAMEHQGAAWVGPSSGVVSGRRGGDGGSAAARLSVAAGAETLLAMLAGMMLLSLASARGVTAAVLLRRTAPALATLVAFVGLGLLVACGGSGGGTMPTGTPAGTYTVTVTATAGTQKATTNLSVIVE